MLNDSQESVFLFFLFAQHYDVTVKLTFNLKCYHFIISLLAYELLNYGLNHILLGHSDREC